jgi:hypothetical protein
MMCSLSIATMSSGNFQIVSPQGCTRRVAAYENRVAASSIAGFRVRRILEAGDEVAAELERLGILATPVRNLPAGSKMKAFVAMFLAVGEVVWQRNCDWYPPFDAQIEPGVSG